MLACLDLGSRTLVAVEQARLFAINMLAADQAALARRFSTKDPHPEKWDGVDWEERAGSPKIDGTLIWLACELRDVHDGGDHAIAIGRVLDLEAGDGEPLIFHRGDYRPLAGEGSV
jgi:3-hydroxy-9,10-secoandrosta-1,3,5(10)-triene-9,17-dione monooxygenase reductase component